MEQAMIGFSPPALKLFNRGEGFVDIPLQLNSTALAQELIVRSLPLFDNYTYDKRKLTVCYCGSGLRVEGKGFGRCSTAGPNDKRKLGNP